MATVDSISKESINQIDMIFLCVASNARTMKALAGQILETNNPDVVGALADALEQVASNVGCMADKGAMILGSPGCVGGVEEWIFPPSLRGETKQQVDESVHLG
jgi:hypothetical protein